MKTILITGGTSGIGKGIALSSLKKGHRVIVVGNSLINGDNFYTEAKKIDAQDRALYIQADLSSIKENQRVIQEINSRFESLEKSENPIIINICGSGMKGEVNWSDLGHKQNFVPQKVMFHSSRLNDLLGVQFAQNDTVGKIKYIMYNPWGVRTPGMMEVYNTPLKWSFFKLFSKPVEEAIIPVTNLLDNPPVSTLSAYRVHNKLNLNIRSYDPVNAKYFTK